MKLIYDDFDEVWVWVRKENENDEMSPQFDNEYAAIAWLNEIEQYITERD